MAKNCPTPADKGNQKEAGKVTEIKVRVMERVMDRRVILEKAENKERPESVTVQLWEAGTLV